jgi:TolB-like protein/Tfp pilus assembly protein PilF
MKQCPDCRRTYTDESLNYCLDDGASLIYAPGSDGPVTAVLKATEPHESPTRHYSPHSHQARLSSEVSLKTPSSSVKPGRWPVAAIAGLLAVAVVGFTAYRYFANDRGSINSIAVLPFTNESADHDLEYISDGLPETLIYRLSQIPQLKVSPRSTVFMYKGKALQPAVVGNELGADAVLSGNVTQRGENLIVNVELIDVRSNKLIWGEQYDRKAADLLVMQREIAGKITDSLKLKMSGAEKQIAGKQYTTSPEAYQLYLKGRYNFAKRAGVNLTAAMEQFKQAVALDPNFALAYTGLADCYSLLPIYDLTGRAKAVETMPMAKESVLKAISIDDDLAEAHASLALIYDIFDWNTTAAEKEYRRAIELNPNYSSAHQWYGEMLSNLGRFDEGLAESRLAIEVEPFSMPANFAFGLNLYKARRYDEAIVQLGKLLELAPDYTDARHFMFETYSAKGDYPDAVRSYLRQRQLDGERKEDLDKMQAAFVKGGWEAFISARLRLIESNSAMKIDPNEVACFYAAASDKDKAIEWLNRSYANRDEGLTWLIVAPRYDNLRDDPRFQEFVKKVGFAD